MSGGNVLARWRRSSGEASDLQLRAYYDYTRRDDPSFLDTLHTFDMDLQQRFAAWCAARNHLGRGYRLTANRNRAAGIFAVDPEKSDDQVFSGFIQDQISLVDSVRLTLGTKLEHNDFSGFEVQPSVRMAWLPRDGPDAVVGDFARRARADAIRARHRDRGHATRRQPGRQTAGQRRFRVRGVDRLRSGIPLAAARNLSFDLALFYNDYERLASLEFGTFSSIPRGPTVIPIVSRKPDRRAHARRRTPGRVAARSTTGD